MADYHIGACFNLQLLSMEIDPNKEESTEICQFINFSIREYVDGIRKKNPEKCWPFGSWHGPDNNVVSSYQSSKSTCVSGQNCPYDINGSKDTTELTEAPNYRIKSLGIGNGSSELTYCKVNIGQNRHENNVDEGAKNRQNVAVDNNVAGSTRPRKKHHKFRLLSDIYKDPASELRAGCDRTHPENVNKGFATEIEDESDDVTLAAYFKKQKGVEITDSMLKKRNVTGVGESSVDQDKKSNHGSREPIGKDSNGSISRKKSRADDTDTQTMAENNKDFRLQCSQKNNRFAEGSSKEAAEKEKEKENEDSEMEAVMLLARHFSEEKQIQRELETNTTCPCAKKKIREHPTPSGIKPVCKTSSKTTTKRRVKKITKGKLENVFCSVQRRSFISVKATIGGSFQSHIEMSITNAAAGVQNRATLVCSFNRNPADFSTPNDQNKFMRGG